MDGGFTVMFDAASERGMAVTPAGMAHWAGSGPLGEFCSACIAFRVDGKHALFGNPNGSCNTYAGMMGRRLKKRPSFPSLTPACKYFERKGKPH